MATIYNRTAGKTRNVKNGPYLIRRAQDVTLLALTLDVSRWGNNTLRAVMTDGTEYTQRITDPQDAFTLLERPQLAGKNLNLIYRTDQGHGYTLRTTTTTYKTDPTDRSVRDDAAVALRIGYYGTYTDTLPLTSNGISGPMVYYDVDGDTLCGECATQQVKDNAQPDATRTASDVLIGCDVLEGSAQDHGVVLCAGCGTFIVDIDADDEWECIGCGSVNGKGDMCRCGNTEQKQDAQIEQAAAGQLTLPL